MVTGKFSEEFRVHTQTFRSTPNKHNTTRIALAHAVRNSEVFLVEQDASANHSIHNKKKMVHVLIVLQLRCWLINITTAYFE